MGGRLGYPIDGRSEGIEILKRSKLDSFLTKG